MQDIPVGLSYLLKPKRSLDVRSNSENEDSFTLENINHLRTKMDSGVISGPMSSGITTAIVRTTDFKLTQIYNTKLLDKIHC